LGFASLGLSPSMPLPLGPLADALSWCSPTDPTCQPRALKRLRVKGFWSSSQHFGEALTGLSPYASEFQRAVEVGLVSFETAGPFEVPVLVLLSLCRRFRT
jgi:hypothetical protein